jgi:NAD(P)-dependent dehydrogenase (short-subunit alcohol dehydrogenase family)
MFQVNPGNVGGLRGVMIIRMAAIESGKFSLAGKTVLVCGGTGVLGLGMAEALGLAGAKVAVAGLAGFAEAQARLAGKGVKALGIPLDAFDKAQVEEAHRRTVAEFGPVDVLVNAVGGNMKGATTAPDLSFFDIPLDAMERVVGLNLFAGAVIPSQVVGRAMAESGRKSVIINISSMNAFRPLTRIAGYSAAKAAVNNFTQWLAVHLAREYGGKIRVNAIAPGFFLTEQNRFLLTEKDGSLTERGKSIIAHTPLGRFGEPGDLAGTVVWLASDASEFVTGAVIPVDGGFSAYSGV